MTEAAGGRWVHGRLRRQRRHKTAESPSGLLGRLSGTFEDRQPGASATALPVTLINAGTRRDSSRGSRRPLHGNAGRILLAKRSSSRKTPGRLGITST